MRTGIDVINFDVLGHFVHDFARFTDLLLIELARFAISIFILTYAMGTLVKISKTVIYVLINQPIRYIELHVRLTNWTLTNRDPD